MAERNDEANPTSGRPSFTKFWNRIKQVHSTDNLRFVSSGPHRGQQDQSDDGDNSSGGGGGGGSSSRAATATATKAQARRAQVRKAQIQHRQRKANYTKQLEMDIAKLRDGIARVEGEGAVLRSENNTIRQRLTLAGVATPPPPIMGTTATTAPATATTTSWTASTSSPSPPVTQYTVSLDMSETNSPAYQVYRTSGSTPPSGGSIPGRGFPGSSSDASGPTALTAMEGVWDESGGGSSSSSKGFNLTEAQSDYAINFILALEHVCWDHFHPSYFAPHAHNVDESGEENGHMLMASAIALQSAPAHVFEQMGEVRENMSLQQQQSQPSQSSSTGTSNTPSRTAAAHRNRLSQPSYNLPPPPHQQSQSQSQSQQHQQKPLPVPSPASWKIPPPTATSTTSTSGGASAGLTLENLRRLAAALNPPDVELTPVQAWFEIARARGPAVALDGALMDALRRELALHVRCVQFGAIMQRDAFDDVIGRVVGGGGGGRPC